MTSLEYFRLLAPEFAAVSDTVVNQWLLIATNLVNPGCLPAETLNMAIALYAAHMLSIATNSASGGATGYAAVKREKEGDLEREYSVSATSGAVNYWDSTPYGIQFNQLTLGCFGAAIMTRGISDGGNAYPGSWL